MKQKKFAPQSDVMFKVVFSKSRNLPLIKDFLRSILSFPEEEYDGLSLADPSLHPKTVNSKRLVPDIVLISKSKKIIHLEMQKKNHSHFIERMFLYAEPLSKLG